MNTENEYTKQAAEFAAKHKITLEAVGTPSLKHHFSSDKKPRYVFDMELSREDRGGCYSFEFGQSIANGAEEPTMYDVLACLTKSDPGSFEDFCDEYGYDEDSRNAYSVWGAVCEEWANIEDLFGDIIEELQEIN